MAKGDNKFDEILQLEQSSAFIFVKTGKAYGLDSVKTQEILYFGTKSKPGSFNSSINVPRETLFFSSE